MSSFLPTQFLNNREICSLFSSCRKLVYKINQGSIYRRRELKYRTKAKFDDFKLWLIQIGMFFLYVKLVVKTTFPQAQVVTGLQRKTSRSFTKKESLVSILREFVTLIRTYYRFLTTNKVVYHDICFLKYSDLKLKRFNEPSKKRKCTEDESGRKSTLCQLSREKDLTYSVVGLVKSTLMLISSQQGHIR